MSEVALPDSNAPTIEWVAYGESRARLLFRDELRGYFELADEILDAAGELVSRIEDSPGDRKAIHVAALILARITSDLRACTHLIRTGYPAQAFTIVGTMLELTHVLAYVGADEKRAQDWLAWSDPKKSYPGPIADTIKKVAKIFGADAASVEREYGTIYRLLCQIKHGNPMLLDLPNVVTIRDVQYVVIGPLISDGFIRLGHGAAQWATRYALLASTAFVHFHIPLDVRPAFSSRQSALTTKYQELAAGTKERFEEPRASGNSA
jgi:hypothetical protein